MTLSYSLRTGFLTSAARRGASVFKMRDVSRHKSMDVLQAYVRDADLFRDHAGGWLALVLKAALPAFRSIIALIRHRAGSGSPSRQISQLQGLG
jgi:hypothetical protein